MIRQKSKGKIPIGLGAISHLRQIKLSAFPGLRLSAGILLRSLRFLGIFFIRGGRLIYIFIIIWLIIIRLINSRGNILIRVCG